MGPDADPLAVADAVGAAGAVVARIAPGVFWAGAVAGCEAFVDGGAAAPGIDDWLCAGAGAPLGCGGAAAAGAVGPEAGAAIALTALGRVPITSVHYAGDIPGFLAAGWP